MQTRNLRSIRYVVGIDEAGRGPLAGPVAVGTALVSKDFDWKRLPRVHDSKKLAPALRSRIFMQAKALQREGELRFAVSLVSAAVIDRIGISAAVARGIASCCRRLELDPQKTLVLLDGLLSAPEHFVHQETIIKGDEKEKVIGLASIMAKVTRDRYMERLARKYSAYGFEVHKGYGTEMHRRVISARGLSLHHRSSFCRNIVLKNKKQRALVA